MLVPPLRSKKILASSALQVQVLVVFSQVRLANPNAMPGQKKTSAVSSASSAKCKLDLSLRYI